MRPDIYPEPEEFKPERFLHNQPDTYAWIPFGGGRRRCLGLRLAMFEMRILLAMVLHHVRFQPRQGKPPRIQRRGLFLAPSDRATFTVDATSNSV
jgi:cytochrome P450